MKLGEPVKTEDGSYTIRHPEHGECYHSYDGAAKEARDLYIERSGFETIVGSGAQSVRVLDVGLGLAYNALTTIDAWVNLENSGPLEMVSLEISEDLVSALASGKASWSKGWGKTWFDIVSKLEQREGSAASTLKIKYSFADSFWEAEIIHPNLGNKNTLKWLILVGDARNSQSFAEAGLKWDYIWQDPFSPEKNPQMWSAEWFGVMRKESHSETKLMTYSVSRATKDALNDGGWSFDKVDTTTRKRHWIKAVPKI
jgi:tRNA U34 5-methylaminomethyl-2-thiouridine-forming methyltransferase MnmC